MLMLLSSGHGLCWCWCQLIVKQSGDFLVLSRFAMSVGQKHQQTRQSEADKTKRCRQDKAMQTRQSDADKDKDKAKQSKAKHKYKQLRRAINK
jgi:hypothetical protein